jgi:hypothetical protein
MPVGGILASLDGPGGFRMVIEALIDCFVAVEELLLRCCAFLCLRFSWLTIFCPYLLLTTVACLCFIRPSILSTSATIDLGARHHIALRPTGSRT